MNGFGRGSLTAEALELYMARYRVLWKMRLPSSSGWKMAVNGVSIPVMPTPRQVQRCRLQPMERTDPTWVATDNDEWWIDLIETCRNEEMHRLDGLIEPQMQWSKADRHLF
jgi:hypothetical protein